MAIMIKSEGNITGLAALIQSRLDESIVKSILMPEALSGSARHLSS